MRIRLYVSGVTVAALIVLLYALVTYPVLRWDLVVFLAAVAMLAEWFAVDLPVVGSASLSLAVLFASVVLGGPAMGGLVALIGSISLRDIMAGKPLPRMVFNTAQYVLFTVLAGIAQSAMGVPTLLGSADPLETNLQWWAGTAVLAIVMASTNALLTGTAISISSGEPLWTVLKGASSTYAVNLPALALMGVVLAQLIYIAGIPASLLLLVPFAVARQTFLVYSQQSEAYRETVKSLVTTLEAKDPYTRGHSERVAWYAREISEEIGLSDLEVQRIEWSALLHDIGKVAIARRTLTKPEKLSDEEYQRIKEHPTTAAEILAEIELLDEVIPYVAMHHERIDGRGYPKGVPGESLPLGARILAVADCFDAMTSDRAYRAGLSHQEAIEELNRVRDQQIDGELADALLRRIDSHTMDRLLEGSGRIDA